MASNGTGLNELKNFREQASSGGSLSPATATTDGLMSSADKAKLDGLGSNATTTAAGLMSSADKAKLDGLNANNYVPRMTPQTFTIATSAWTKNSAETSEFVYYADITVSGLTANDYAEVNFDRASQSAVVAANLCAAGDTLSGKIRLYAENAPESSIGGQYIITKGAV